MIISMLWHQQWISQASDQKEISHLYLYTLNSILIYLKGVGKMFRWSSLTEMHKYIWFVVWEMYIKVLKLRIFIYLKTVNPYGMDVEFRIAQNGRITINNICMNWSLFVDKKIFMQIIMTAVVLGANCQKLRSDPVLIKCVWNAFWNKTRKKYTILPFIWLLCRCQLKYI